MLKSKVPYIGLFTACALIMSYIELLIPFAFGVPGVKLGLTNIVILIVLYLSGPKDAFMVSVARIILAGFMFTNIYSFLYSLAGGMLSLLVMSLFKKIDKFSIIGVSVAGGISHNIAQIILAIFVVETVSIAYYLPVLLIAGVVTGMLIGMVGKNLIPRVKKIYKSNNE